MLKSSCTSFANNARLLQISLSIGACAWFARHISGLQLQASADSGCHICTVIWGTLSLSFRKILRDLETELTVFGPSSQSMPKRSYELIIPLAGLGVHGEVLLNVALHRDPQGGYTSHHPLEHLNGLGSQPRLYLTGTMKPSDVNTLDPKYGLRFVVKRSYLRNVFHFDLILRHCEFATISTASNDALHQASLWIDERLNEHPNHHSTMSTQSYKPTRVIDVSPNTESRNPRLHITSPEETDLKYTTLSHC